MGLQKQKEAAQSQTKRYQLIHSPFLELMSRRYPFPKCRGRTHTNCNPCLLSPHSHHPLQIFLNLRLPLDPLPISIGSPLLH